jgi:ribonuclease E
MNSEKNRILINATQPGEIRVALLEENKLSDLDIEYTGHEQKKSNIYKGKISRIEPSLEATFIDYGAERHGFLPFKEIDPSYFKSKGNDDLQLIKSSLKVGQEMMVQIEKEERGNKGAALTTYITLPGSYLVLMPNNPGAGGISRRIEGNERRTMQDILNQLAVPENMGLILRTAGVGRDLKELQSDLNLLLKQWEAIQKAFNARPAPFLIFQEGDLVTRSIRDYLRRDIDEIIIDNKNIYEKTKQYIEQIRPDFVSRITLYQNPTPLFLQFGVEEAAESAFQHEIRLASGGTIVIDRTEALVAIDINSGRSTKNGDIEETAIKTNLEAAKEIAHQLRVRDLGGLIVIDFIDMNLEENKRKVENCLREVTKKDRARIQIGRISTFGLLEMSRQRLRHSLGKANEALCPHCNGQGIIRNIESLTFSLIRSIEKEALKKSTRQIRVELPVDMATYLINEKRDAITQIEQRYKITLLIIPNPYWLSPKYKVTSINNLSDKDKETHLASHELLEDKSRADVSIPYSSTSEHPIEVPAVKPVGFHISDGKSKNQLGLLGRVFSKLSDLAKVKKATPTPVQAPKKERTVNPREKYYGKTNKGGRSHNRREHSQNSRYSASGQNRYEQRSTVTGRKNQPKKKLTEDNTKTIKHREFRSPSPSFAERQAASAYQACSELTHEATTNQTLATSPVGTTSPVNTKATRVRKNTRRYGGEPKLRQRSYE